MSKLWSSTDIKKAQNNNDIPAMLSMLHDNHEHFKKEFHIGKLWIDWTTYYIPNLRICWLGKHKWFFSFSIGQPL